MAQPSIPTHATEEDTCPKVLIHEEWCKVLDAYPKDASSQLERDQQFINELAKQLVAESRVDCQLQSPSPATQMLSSSTSVHCAATCSGCMSCSLIFSSAYLVYQSLSV